MTIKFPGGTKSVISTKGVHLYLDTKGEHDIGGEDYVGFTTIFRNDEVTAAYGITGYTGTAEQNIHLLNLLRTGQLIRV